MASPKKSFADSFTIESLLGGSNAPPTSSGGPKVVGETLFSVNRGEKVTTSDTGDKDIYPPVYGGGNRQITVTTKKRRGSGSAGGYKPSSNDQSSAPNTN